MSAIKVGDYVEVKSWEEMEKEFGVKEKKEFGGVKYIPCKLNFTEHMKELCGFKFEVVEIINDHILNGFIPFKDNIVVLSTDMVKVIEKPECDEECECFACSAVENIIDSPFESDGSLDSLFESDESLDSEEPLELEMALSESLIEELLKDIKGADMEVLQAIKQTLDKVGEQLSKLHIALDEEMKKQEAKAEYSELEERCDMLADLQKRMQMFAHTYNDKNFNVFDKELRRWTIVYDGKNVEIVKCGVMQSIGNVVFSSEQVAEKALKLFGDEIKLCYENIK